MTDTTKKIPEITTILKGGETQLIKINGNMIEIFQLNLEQKSELLDLFGMFVPLLRQVMGDYRFMNLGFDVELKKSNLRQSDMLCVLATVAKKEITIRLLSLIAESMHKDVKWIADQNFEPKHLFEIGKIICELNKLGDLLPFFGETSTTPTGEEKEKEVPEAQ